MTTITRRIFAARLFAVSLLPWLKVRAGTQQEQGTPKSAPERIAGYNLTEDDRSVLAKYQSNLEKDMAPLRERDLPNSLAPLILFRSAPVKKRERAKR